VSRITLVISSLGPGGAERVLATMANHWSAAGREVTVVTLGDGEPFYRLDPRVKRVDLALTGQSPTPAHAVWRNLGRVRRLRETLAALAPGVVISLIDQTNVLTLLAARPLGIPVIVTEHSDQLLGQIGVAWRGLRRWTYPGARRVVVLNERMRRRFAAWLGSRVVVIPNAVEAPGDTGPAGDPAAPVRTVVSMGRLGEEKRFDLLLRAFARVSPAHPDWRLLILGDGPLRAELEALRDSLGLRDRVELPGVVREPHAALRRGDLFVLASRTEAFPMALVEAMACGLAVIATEYHEGVREIVRDGVDGRLVAPGDPEALGAAMDHLMGDAAARGRLAARALEVRERFGVPSVMARWDHLLEGVVAPCP
jgi:glycosyltransferase involved in cell wall biosynthesis